MHDPPRLLARRSELAYVTTPTQALTLEPEAITAEDQQWLTDQATQLLEQRRRENLDTTRQRIQRELDYHQAQARARQRQLRRLQRKLDTA